MSKTFTSRPAVVQGRGRGRGTQTRPLNATNNRATRMDTGVRPRVGQSQQPQAEQQQGESAERPLDQRMSYEGGFTKIAPNMKKRQQISSVASRESEAYEAHKQQNTPKSFSYVGTAGGGQTSLGESRQRLTQTSPNKTQKLLQNQQRKSLLKQKEEEEILKKKEAQRQKAVQNERRKKETEEAAANKWDEQRRRTNEAFLNRLDAKSKRNMQENSMTDPPSSETQTARVETTKTQGRFEPDGANITGEATAQDVNTNHAECSPGSLSLEQRRIVTGLSAMFPDYPKDTLVELLEQVDFSADAAITLLSE